MNTFVDFDLIGFDLAILVIIRFFFFLKYLGDNNIDKIPVADEFKINLT